MGTGRLEGPLGGSSAAWSELAAPPQKQLESTAVAATEPTETSSRGQGLTRYFPGLRTRETASAGTTAGANPATPTPALV
jgi:hypothetical protein